MRMSDCINQHHARRVVVVASKNTLTSNLTYMVKNVDPSIIEGRPPFSWLRERSVSTYAPYVASTYIFHLKLVKVLSSTSDLYFEGNHEIIHISNA
jgi:hypothetical protein